MITKKICMLGAFSVGKTSLVEHFVHSIFSDSYVSTIGVKISKKRIVTKNEELTLVLWDLEGNDDYVGINMTYIKGAAGLFVVADLTRKETLDIALQIRANAIELIGHSVPNILLLNKSDIEPREITAQQITKLTASGIPVLLTSAKTSENVENAFAFIAHRMIL